MTAPVDVLAVLRWASVSADNVHDRDYADQARAAVAELIDWTARYLGSDYHDPDRESATSYLDRRAREKRWLQAALARCKGAQS